MPDESLLLTPKNLYRLLTGSLPEISALPLLKKERPGVETLSRFWWHALMDIVPGDVLDPFFNVASGRSRSLSDIMNRTRVPALPAKLKTALETGLDAERFRGLVLWIFGLLDPTRPVSALEQTLTAFEDRCARTDIAFEEQLPFFTGLRDGANGAMRHARAVFHVAIRVAWLLLHAIFGDEMDNDGLSLLKANPACAERVLWHACQQSLENDAPAENAAQAVSEAVLSFTEPEELPEDQLTDQLNRALAARNEPPEDAGYFRRFAGWYVVANWTDPCIALNDTARPTYEGAKLQAQIPNGTPVWILMASGYKGLNKSSCCWGVVWRDGVLGFVPMTYLMRMNLTN